MLVISCNSIDCVSVILESDSIQTVNLNNHLTNEVYNSDQIIDTMKIVFLETNDKSLISNPLKAVLTDKFIYIQDTYQESGVIIFDTNGKFVKRLERGNGPGEFSRVLSIGFDKYKQELLVLTNPLLIRYDAEGNFINSIQLDFPTDNIIGCSQNCYIFSKVYGHNSSGYLNIDNYSLLVASKDGNLTQLLVPYNNTIISGRTSSFEYSDKIMIGTAYSDSIYYFKNDSLYYFRSINYSNKKLELGQFASFEDFIKNYLMNAETSELFFDASFFENTTHLLFYFLCGNKTYNILIDKQNGKVISGLYQRYDKSESLFIPPAIGVDNDCFFSFSGAEDYAKGSLTNPKYLSKDDVEKLENLDIEDNPFLIFYKLKSFE